MEHLAWARHYPKQALNVLIQVMLTTTLFIITPILLVITLRPREVKGFLQVVAQPVSGRAGLNPDLPLVTPP